MSRIYLAIAALFVLAGIVAALFAPTESMGLREAFFARLLLLGPSLFIGAIISALAVIMRQLEALSAGLSARGTRFLHDDVPKISGEDFEYARVEDEPVPAQKTDAGSKLSGAQPAGDFETFFNAEMRKSQPEAIPVVSQEKRPLATGMQSAVQWPDKSDWSAKAEEQRVPTVDEYLSHGQQTDSVPQNTAPLVREGNFAGRRYRMFDDGSLEIDTDQSTIRFASLEEFRAFVSAAGKREA